MNIVCGNSDYTITFTFDDEWSAEAVKTARFVYNRAGKRLYQDVVFSGDTIAVPVLSNVSFVLVGVYAGDLRTTTPAIIGCEKSILCGGGSTHDDPPEDVYNQILEAVNEILGISGNHANLKNNPHNVTASQVGATPASHEMNTSNPHGVTAEQVGARPNNWMPTASEVGARPDNWMPTASEVGARANTWTPSASDVGADPAGSASAVQKNLDDHTGNVENPHNVTAEQVGARPNTWTPSAEEVGARPSDWMPTASDVGARPATWLPTPEEIGSAPSGYGLGSVQPIEWSDIDNITANGWYSAIVNGEITSGATAYMVWIRVDGLDTNYACQTAYITGADCVLERHKQAGVWGEWGFKNPPMYPGVEYRTTERNNGKVVYTMFVDCGILPNAETKRIHYTNRAVKCISLEHGAKITDSGVNIYKGHPYIGIWDSESNSIVIRASGNMSTMTGWAVVKYVDL